MRRIITLIVVALLVAAMLAIIALPAFAVGQNPPTSCGVGRATSAGNEVLHEEGFQGGLGKALHETGRNPGEAIQTGHEEIQDLCHLV
jgi:hypothetical protein